MISLSVKNRFLIKVIVSLIFVILILVSYNFIGFDIKYDSKSLAILKERFYGWGSGDNSLKNIDAKLSKVDTIGIHGFFPLSIICFVASLMYFIYVLTFYILSFKNDAILGVKVRHFIDLICQVIISILIIVDIYFWSNIAKEALSCYAIPTPTPKSEIGKYYPYHNTGPIVIGTYGNISSSLLGLGTALSNIIIIFIADGMKWPWQNNYY